MILALDASAAAEVVLARPKARFMGKAIEEAEWVLAPDLFVAELSNVLWKCHALAGMEAEECATRTEAGILLVDDFVPSGELWREALAEAAKSGHPVYDLLYLVVARRNGAALATCDRRRRELAKKLKVGLV